MRRFVGFAAALSLTLLLAVDGGGYDVVVRHEVALVLWVLIALGLALGVLPRSRLSPASWCALGGFAALAVLTLLALSWTESDERTTTELARVLQYMGLVTLIYLSLNRETWQGAAAGFAGAAVLVSFLAVGSRLFPGIVIDDVARTLGTDRLSYPLDYWNGVACWGAMATAIALCWSAHAERAIVRSGALAVVPVAVLSVYLTYSRFGVAAVLIAAGAAILLCRHRWTVSLHAAAAAGASAVVILTVRGQDEIARGTGGGGAGAVVLILLLAMLGCAGAAILSARLDTDRLRMKPSSARLALVGGVVCVLLAAAALHRPINTAWDEFKNDRTVAGSAANPTERLSSLGGTRYVVWKEAVKAFKSDPMRGIGPGSFEFYWSQEGDGSEFLRDAHSLYLEDMAELGLPGLASIIVVLGGLLIAALAARRTWRRDRDLAAGSALIAAFLVFLAYAAVDWMWELGAVGTLALGGAAVAGSGGLPRAARRVPRPWLRAALVAAAIAAAAVQIPTLVSVQRTRASQSATEAGNPARGVDLANDAIDAEPWAGSPYATRALAEEAQGNLDQAKLDVGDAIEREPTNWRHHLLLARIDARLGDRPAVDAEIAELERLAPHSPYLVVTSPYRVGLDQILRSSSRSAGR